MNRPLIVNDKTNNDFILNKFLSMKRTLIGQFGNKKSIDDWLLLQHWPINSSADEAIQLNIVYWLINIKSRFRRSVLNLPFPPKALIQSVAFFHLCISLRYLHIVVLTMDRLITTIPYAKLTVPVLTMSNQNMPDLNSFVDTKLTHFVNESLVNTFELSANRKRK
jgi:hypothetical protein